MKVLDPVLPWQLFLLSLVKEYIIWEVKEQKLNEEMTHALVKFSLSLGPQLHGIWGSLRLKCQRKGKLITIIITSIVSILIHVCISVVCIHVSRCVALPTVRGAWPLAVRLWQPLEIVNHIHIRSKHSK